MYFIGVPFGSIDVLPENNTFKQNISKEISADIEDTFIRDCRIEREQSQIEAYRREHGHGW